MTDASANPLTLYNSLTRTKEPFIPQDPKRVTMYNCGPTVYSYAHIGNARAAVVADVLFRVLRHIYGTEENDYEEVVYARNITDVDDKIIASAQEQGVDISEITEKYAKIYQDDLAALNCLPPTKEPKATVHIPDMITMISELIEKGNAYASDGHVFFDVSTYDAYGALSGNTLDALRGGDRVGEGEVARKKNAADFVLWKPELDGVGWDAPFGRGRPGWHIECSAMAKATLGEVIDIHCGGVDLKFPHHENEIAQSCCANDAPKFANYWVHNEFLNMGSGEKKMSKSLGNIILVHDLLKEWDGEVIRLALLKAHYRSELNWSEDLLRESKAQLDGWYRVKQNQLWNNSNQSLDYLFLKFLLEDLLLPKALPRISYLLRDPYKNFSIEELEKLDFEIVEPSYPGEEPKAILFSTILNSANLLGLLQKDPEDWFSGGISDEDKALAAAYDEARAKALSAKAAGDKSAMGEAFKASDAIRDELTAKGLILETSSDGKSKLRKA